jgi:hypothetical protein
MFSSELAVPPVCTNTSFCDALMPLYTADLFL